MKDKLFSVTLVDCDVETFRAGGPGGQNQNKRDTGVRIRHRASGAVGEARDQRSQEQNKRAAFRRMAASDPFKAWLHLEIARRTGELKAIEREVIEELEVVPRQYFKKLVDSEGIWEVRVQFANDIFRLLGFIDGGSLLILTNGFAKKTQKTPPQEIALAIRRKNEYLARRK